MREIQARILSEEKIKNGANNLSLVTSEHSDPFSRCQILLALSTSRQGKACLGQMGKQFNGIASYIMYVHITSRVYC